MSVCNCVISVKKCFLSPNNGFLRFCQGKTQVPINNYILNSTNRITTVLCQKCLAQQAHIIRASTLHPSSTILLLSYIFLCEQKNILLGITLRKSVDLDLVDLYCPQQDYLLQAFLAFVTCCEKNKKMMKNSGGWWAPFVLKTGWQTFDRGNEIICHFYLILSSKIKNVMIKYFSNLVI